MCMIKQPDIPEVKAPMPTQAAKAPTRVWANDPSANRPTALTRSAGTARPTTTAPGSVLGR